MAFEIDKQFVLSVAETAFPYIISINVSLHWVTHVDCGPLRYSQSTYLVLPPKLKANHGQERQVIQREINTATKSYFTPTVTSRYI